MSTSAAATATASSNGNHPKVGTNVVKQGLAQMLKGGVIVRSILIMIILIIIISNVNGESNV